MGGGPAGPEGVTVKHIDPAIFGHTVHATIFQDRWSGMTGAAAQPARTYDGDVPVGPDGSVTLPVTNGDQGDGAGGNAASCQATGPRVPGKIGNALALCGNNEYVSLPSGIMQGVSDFTISAWVNPSADTAWSRVFDFGTGTNDYMFLTLNAGGGPIRFAITTSGAGGEQQINGTGELPLQHLVARGRDAVRQHRDAVRQRHRGRQQQQHDAEPGRAGRHHPGLDRPLAVPGRPVPGRRDRRLPDLQQRTERQPDRRAGRWPARGGQRRRLQVRRDGRRHRGRLLRQRAERDDHLQSGRAADHGRLRGHPGPGRYRLADPHRQHLAAQLPGRAGHADRHRLEHQHRGDTQQSGRLRHRGGTGRGRPAHRVGHRHHVPRGRAADRRLQPVHLRWQRLGRLRRVRPDQHLRPGGRRQPAAGVAAGRLQLGDLEPRRHHRAPDRGPA